MKRGSKVVWCPTCGTVHLASQVARERGVWWLLCRYCGKLLWQARLT